MPVELENPVLKQLKERFPTPKDAYLYLNIGMEYTKSIAIHPKTKLTEFSKNFLAKQNELNNFLLSLTGQLEIEKIKDKILKIMELEDLNKKKQFIDKFTYDEQIADLSHMQKNEVVAMLTGHSLANIKLAANKIQDWSQIEDILVKYQIKKIPSEETTKKFEEKAQTVIEKFDFAHINIQPFYTQKIDEVKDCAKELSEIIKFDAKQIGQKKLGIHVGYEMHEDFSAYCCSDSEAPYILFKPHTISSTFGHEWMHFIDFTVGQKMKLGDHASEALIGLTEDKTSTKLRAFKGLVDAFREDISVNQKALDEKTKSGMLQIFKRFLSKNIINEEKLAENIENYFFEKQKNDKIDIEKFFKENLKPGYSHHYMAFIEAEMDLHLELQKVQNKNNFLQFAKKADQSLIKITKDNKWEGYTASQIEMLARSFETYLLSKKPKNSVTVAMDTNFYPQKMEAKFFSKRWELALSEIREIFHPNQKMEMKKAAL